MSLRSEDADTTKIAKLASCPASKGIETLVEKELMQRDILLAASSAGKRNYEEV
jgi:hypothetical protein